MGKEKKITFAIPFALASAWFGTHCGSGFATGAQASQFWVEYGAWAYLLPLISIAIMGIVAYFEFEFCRTFKTFNYRAYADKLYEPYGKIFGLIYEIIFVGIMVMGVSAVFAGAGSLLSSTLGIPYLLGVIVVIILTIVLNAFGTKLLLRSAGILSTILVVIITICTVIGIVYGRQRMGEIAQNWETDYSMGTAVFSAILYASFQCTILGSATNLCDELSSPGESKRAAWLGILLNGGMMILITYMLIGWYPEISSQTLPVMYILQQTGIPGLNTIYSVMLFLAFMTTAITCIGAILKRVESFGEKLLPKITVRRTVFSAIIILICFGIAQFGLLAIIKKGYSAIGYLGIPFVVFPTIILAPLKLRKARNTEKHSDSDQCV